MSLLQLKLKLSQISAPTFDISVYSQLDDSDISNSDQDYESDIYDSAIHESDDSDEDCNTDIEDCDDVIDIDARDQDNDRISDSIEEGVSDGVGDSSDAVSDSRKRMSDSREQMSESSDASDVGYMTDDEAEEVYLNIAGRRIVNLDKVQQLVQIVSIHSVVCKKARRLGRRGKCALVMLGESHRAGLASIFRIKCKGCRKCFDIEMGNKIRDPNGHLHCEINLAAVWGEYLSRYR